MLKKFEISNTYSYLERVALDMSTALSENEVDENGNPMPVDPSLYEVVRGRIPGRKYGILPVAAIYGKNASGKTKLIKSLSDAVKDVLGLSFSEADASATVSQIVRNRQFVIMDEDKRPTSIEYCITIVIEDTEYALEYKINKDGVEGEKLTYRKMYGDEKPNIYYSCGVYGEKNDGSEALKILDSEFYEMYGKKRLVFAFIAPTHQVLKAVFRWFRHANEVLSIEIDTHEKRQARLEEIAKEIDENEQYCEQLLKILKCADKSITGIQGEKGYDDKYILWVFHQNNKSEANWAHNINNESDGTLKIIRQYPSIRSALEYGTPFICDELDRTLHPVVFKGLVRLFNSPKTNPNNAQLIFTAHDTFVLDSDHLRLDEVHIVDKGEFSVSNITRLSEMPEIYTYPDMELDFRTGIYGSFPGDIVKAFTVCDHDE